MSPLPTGFSSSKLLARKVFFARDGFPIRIRTTDNLGAWAQFTTGTASLDHRHEYSVYW